MVSLSGVLASIEIPVSPSSSVSELFTDQESAPVPSVVSTVPAAPIDAGSVHVCVLLFAWGWIVMISELPLPPAPDPIMLRDVTAPVTISLSEVYERSSPPFWPERSWFTKKPEFTAHVTVFDAELLR